jgi:membrane protein
MEVSGSFMATQSVAAPPPVTPWSIKGLLHDTWESWIAVNAPRLGAALAFYTALSMAPLLIFCIGVASLIFGRKAAQGQIIWQAGRFIGEQGGAVIQSMLLESSKGSTGIVWAMVGVFMLIFGASGVFGELRDSLNLVWGVKTTSSGLKGMVRYRFVSFAMVVGIGFLLIVSLLVSAAIAAAGKFFSQFLPAPESL